MPKIFLILFPLTFFPFWAFADGLSADPSQAVRQPPSQAGNVPSENIDGRLPPVIPGQRVTAGGTKHKVISTSGPVPGSYVPEPPSPPTNAGSRVDSLGGVSVIIDRDGKPDHHHDGR